MVHRASRTEELETGPGLANLKSCVKTQTSRRFEASACNCSSSIILRAKSHTEYG